MLTGRVTCWELLGPDVAETGLGTAERCCSR